MSTMAVIAVHEEVDGGTSQQEKPEERSKDVGLVFFPEEVHGDCRYQTSRYQDWLGKSPHLRARASRHDSFLP